MTGIEPLVEQNLELTEQFVLRFNAARDLGLTAMSLNRQAQQIINIRDAIVPESFDVPEEINLWLEPTRPEDRLITETKVWSYNGDYWEYAGPGHEAYKANVISLPGKPMFRAFSLHSEIYEIWAYNRDKSFRVLFRSDVAIKYLQIPDSDN